MPLRLVALALIAASFLPNPVQAQQSNKVFVELRHSGSDSVGSRIAFELREAIRGSLSMQLVTQSEADPRIVVDLVSVEGGTSPGSSTAIALVIALDSKNFPFSGYLVDARVQTCGTLRSQECARNIAGNIDAAIEKLKKDYPSYLSSITGASTRRAPSGQPL